MFDDHAAVRTLVALRRPFLCLGVALAAVAATGPHSWEGGHRVGPVALALAAHACWLSFAGSLCARDLAGTAVDPSP